MTPRKSILIVAAVLLTVVLVLAEKQSPPPGGPPKDFDLPPAKTLTLDNGLRATLVQYGKLPKVTISVRVRAGNLNETAEQVDATGTWWGHATGPSSRGDRVLGCGQFLPDPVTAGIPHRVSLVTARRSARTPNAGAPIGRNYYLWVELYDPTKHLRLDWRPATIHDLLL